MNFDHWTTFHKLLTFPHFEKFFCWTSTDDVDCFLIWILIKNMSLEILIFFGMNCIFFFILDLCDFVFINWWNFFNQWRFINRWLVLSWRNSFFWTSTDDVEILRFFSQEPLWICNPFFLVTYQQYVFKDYCDLSNMNKWCLFWKTCHWGKNMVKKNLMTFGWWKTLMNDCSSKIYWLLMSKKFILRKTQTKKKTVIVDVLTIHDI